MTIASEITNYANGLSDAYDAVNDMSGIIPTDKNMNNLDTAIRTIPQSTGPTYTAGNGIDITNDVISIDDTVVAELSDLPGVMTGATSQQAGTSGLVPAPTTSDPEKYLKGDGTWDTPTGTTYSAGTNVQISAGNVISATDTTYSDFTGATSGAAGAHGLVPAPAAGDQGKALKGDGTWGDFSEKFVIMKYGEASAWAKFIDAYNNNKIVYCRASSNANPATGAQTRLAFMAYVSNETTPTSVEFQYVRSVGSKTSSQPVDQVFVYKLTNASGGTWSVETRDMAPKLAAGTNTSVSYSNGTYTVNATDTTYTAGNHIDITNDVITAEGYIWGDTLTSATTPTGTVTSGMIADGTIQASDIATGVVPVITMTDTDPGEGSPLAANHFIAVYEP